MKPAEGLQLQTVLEKAAALHERAVREKNHQVKVVYGGIVKLGGLCYPSSVSADCESSVTAALL